MSAPDDAHLAVRKMSEAQAHPIEIAAFRHRLEQLANPTAGLVHSDELEPVDDQLTLEELPEPDAEAARDVFDRLVVLKLNGGLGTSMGLDIPKSMIEIKPGHSFLDVIATQTLDLRRRYVGRLPLLMMNSGSTRLPTLERLRAYEGLRDQELPLDFLQGQEPKLRADDHEPVDWPADPGLEWCPPGHGDIYPSLAASGMLERLLDAGVRWCFVSNADNLGAEPDPRIASWIAREQVPFLLEVVRGTSMDRKGGHLARRDGHIYLRETAQVPEDDPSSFTDFQRWRYYNTNNIWFDLEALRDLQREDPAAPSLPLIVNAKTVDPTDPASTAVLQLETAMGAAVGSIPGARALVVPRTRFAPVKTTDDLLISRSDLYDLQSDGRMAPRFDERAPEVRLDGRYFRMLSDFEARFPDGPPSMRRCTRLEVQGDVTFAGGVVVEGDVRVVGPRRITSQVLRG